MTSLSPIVEASHTGLRNASFTVARDEVVALLGPSGSGKSMLLTAIGLINPATSGRFAIAGQPVMDGPRALVDLRTFRRHHLGFVFQKANLIPFLSARQNVQVVLEINDVALRRLIVPMSCDRSDFHTDVAARSQGTPLLARRPRHVDLG